MIFKPGIAMGALDFLLFWGPFVDVDGHRRGQPDQLIVRHDTHNSNTTA